MLVYSKMKVAPLAISSGKKREVMARKLSVLDAIEEEKGVLFAPISDSVTHADKVKGWQSVLHIAKAVGLVAQNRDWRFVRDKVFSVWKSRAMAKRNNAVAAGPQNNAVKFDRVELKILDIIGQELPFKEVTVDEVFETNDLVQEQVNNPVLHASKKTNTGFKHDIERKNQGRIMKKDDYLWQKKKLNIELLKHDIYLRKLQALKLEKEMGLKRSEYTQTLVTPEVEVMKTENTSEMEFEY